MSSRRMSVENDCRQEMKAPETIPHLSGRADRCDGGYGSDRSDGRNGPDGRDGEHGIDGRNGG